MITRRPGDGAGPAWRRERFERLEREIVGEKAAALGRAGERLERAIAEVHDMRRRCDGLMIPTPGPASGASTPRRANGPSARAWPC